MSWIMFFNVFASLLLSSPSFYCQVASVVNIIIYWFQVALRLSNHSVLQHQVVVDEYFSSLITTENSVSVSLDSPDEIPICMRAQGAQAGNSPL